MRLYTFDYYGYLEDALIEINPTVACGSFQVGHFPNREVHVTCSTPDSDPCVLATLQPPDNHIVETLMLCDTLRRNGAHTVKAILPYLAYSRQDRFEPGGSLAVAWL